MMEYYFYMYMISLALGLASLAAFGIYALVVWIKEKKTEGETDELEGS